MIRTQSEHAVLNTVLYLEKGLREYCLCNVKGNLKVFIIDVIDQSPVIERVHTFEKIILIFRFYQAHHRTYNTRKEKEEIW